MSDPNTVTYETLLSILASYTWSYDSEFSIQITFSEDGGTGSTAVRLHAVLWPGAAVQRNSESFLCQLLDYVNYKLTVLLQRLDGPDSLTRDG